MGNDDELQRQLHAEVADQLRLSTMQLDDLARRVKTALTAMEQADMHWTGFQHGVTTNPEASRAYDTARGALLRFRAILTEPTNFDD